MQPTLARFINTSKASTTSTLCRKEGNSDESELSGDDEKQQSEEDCSESPVDSNSIHTEQATTSKTLRLVQENELLMKSMVITLYGNG